jgi:hypothetical protein
MTKKTFIAQQWFQKESESPAESKSAHTQNLDKENSPAKNRFPTFTSKKKPLKQPDLNDSKFSPVNCFVPGWKGESLSSRQVITFERLLKKIQDDVRAELLKTKDFPRSIKMGLHTEFLSFADGQGLHFEGLDDIGRFWQHLNAEKLAEDKQISQFIDIYAGRIATITFLKLRFIATLLEKCGLELTDRALLAPTSFLSQIFKKGTQAEINSRALESNLYSWYRPNEGMKDSMKELLLLSKELAITEIIKNVSVRTQIAKDQGRVYSHALSQVSLGLFLNSLQINFPLWLETIEGKTIPNGGLQEEEIISCKYYGDYLESLSLSHWLAQENNLNGQWDQILCPDFKGFDFVSGVFTKICNELQFLTFLVHKAEHQQVKPVEYICKIMGSHYCNRKNTTIKQGLLLENNLFYSSTYDRVVLNLCQFPRNNPQHFLISQIMEQVKYLKNDGYLFVLSSKKLFVPSLRERLAPLLKELKAEAIFDLEEVKGKGELGSYIYIFRKRSQEYSSDKQVCSYFRISADLKNFQEFSSITDHLRSFYLSHLVEMPPIAQLEFSDSFRLEYFQEALVNGMLIHSANEDSSRITHPAFFKGLLNSCIPLDTVFEIKSLSLTEKSSNQDFGLNIGLKKDPSYFLVVDFRRGEVNLELHPMDTFRSIHSDYGETLCSYFELNPKIAGLNPNLLRNYFTTPIGKQVTNLTFTSGPSLVKGSLAKLLIPKFMMETDSLPSHLRPTFDLFERSEIEFLEMAPDKVLKSFNHSDQVAKDILPKYACEILSHYSNLERTLLALIWKMDDGRYGQKISFNNPVIQSLLVKKVTRPLYPHNEDVYYDRIENSSPAELHLPLTQTQIKVTHEGDLKFYFLELMSGDRVIVRFCSEEIVILFLNFILSHALNVPISKILKAVHLPSLTDLMSIIDSTEDMKQTYQALLDKVQLSIQSLFRTHVVSPKKPL